MTSTRVGLAVPAEAARRRDTALERLEQLKRRVGLTDLQHRVVTLALAGKSRTEAAREMGISPLTHRTHVTRTLRRTRHRRLAQLVAELAGES